MRYQTPLLASLSATDSACVACLLPSLSVAGFTNVINCVIDNYAQWFCVVPGAINIAQGPANYSALLKMGVPSKEVSTRLSLHA